MSPPIRFSWHAARELRRAGWTYPEIAGALNVHHTSVMYACDPYYRRRKRDAIRQAAARRRAA